VRNSKEIKKNPREAEIIRLIFSFDGSKSGREIAEYLNSKGHKRRNGTEWTQRQVWAVLSRADLYRKGPPRIHLRLASTVSPGGFKLASSMTRPRNDIGFLAGPGRSSGTRPCSSRKCQGSVT